MKLLDNLTELYRFRDLFLSWIRRDLQIRYKQSLLGVLWAVLQPLALMVLFTLVFSYIVTVPTDGTPYPLFAYTGLLPWTFFATSITFGALSLVNNMSLVTKIYFPREILPLASIGAALFDLLIASSVLVVLFLVYQQQIHRTILWVPVLIIIQLVFTAGVILPAAVLVAFYRDIRFIIPIAIQAWLYATPVIYPLSAVPENFRHLFLLNPMSGLIDSYRRVVLQGLPPDSRVLLITTGISLLLLVSGFAYFKKMEGVLPDVI